MVLLMFMLKFLRPVMEATMNNLLIDPLKSENLTAEALRIDEDTAALNLNGAIDMRDTSEVVLPYLIKLHEKIISLGIKKLRLDLVELNYVNSNGIKSLINWIMKLNDLTADNEYKIIIISNSEVAWQESTLPVLQKLFPTTLAIEKKE